MNIGLRGSVAAACLAAAALPLLAADVDESFMPKGGRSLLIELLGAAAAPGQDKPAGPALPALRQLLSTSQGEAQWERFVAERAAAAAPPRERQTLSAYLSVNLPAKLALGKDSVPAMLAALPRDGRDLAWQQCQFCHSLFTSHLTQQRDVQGWRNMFLSPFHRELKMTAQEREEFARYSALNMPMKTEDVPAELRY